MAERALVSRPTLTKLEQGDPNVSLYATVLFVLGMIERLSELADPKYDAIGLSLEDEMLPERIRSHGLLDYRSRSSYRSARVRRN